MFSSIGPWELAIILLIALMVVGPGKLPEVARSIGKGLNEFKKVTNGVRKEFEDVMKEESKPAPKVTQTDAVNPLDSIDLSAVLTPTEESKTELLTAEPVMEKAEKNVDDKTI